MISCFNCSDIISAITGFAALFTALATRKMVREMRKQRESSYYPDLTVDNFSFRAYGKINLKGTTLPTFKELDYYGVKVINEDDASIYLYFNLSNLGLGAAKDITYQFDFDHKKASTIIDKMGNENNAFINFPKGKSGSVPIPSIGSLGHFKIAIPPLIWIHFLYYLQIKNSYSEFEELPKPELTVLYKDMLKRDLMAKFEFSLLGAPSTKEPATTSFTVMVKDIAKKENNP